MVEGKFLTCKNSTGVLQRILQKLSKNPISIKKKHHGPGRLATDATSFMAHQAQGVLQVIDAFRQNQHFAVGLLQLDVHGGHVLPRLIQVFPRQIGGGLNKKAMGLKWMRMLEDLST